MIQVDGSLIVGTYDEADDEFTVQQVKHLTTETVLTKSQCEQLYDYLKKHEKEEGGQVVSLYDQLLIPLKENEIQLLVSDLGRVQQLYQS
ncbi:hypothetical protein [Desertibacillus haloalkaliphilus]|uniref:hypothetical protein n=1 Tax=Desertibacillus haloalkaliphilus TaxID=1328930 RepID=UPI001FEB184C|nr:hypothetical protein [Desertibacillus haloalkaliphilus]